MEGQFLPIESAVRRRERVGGRPSDARHCGIPRVERKKRSMS